METDDAETALEGSRLIVETARILLEAGCDTNKAWECQPLPILFNSFNVTNPSILGDFMHMQACCSQLQLVARLVELLLLYGREPILKKKILLPF